MLQHFTWTGDTPSYNIPEYIQNLYAAKQSRLYTTSGPPVFCSTSHFIGRRIVVRNLPPAGTSRTCTLVNILPLLMELPPSVQFLPYRVSHHRKILAFSPNLLQRMPEKTKHSNVIIGVFAWRSSEQTQRWDVSGTLLCKIKFGKKKHRPFSRLSSFCVGKVYGRSTLKFMLLNNTLSQQ